MVTDTANALTQLYERLLTQYGPQHWWPADTPFEIMVGAILTQNTAWTNVEKAIANLKEAKALSVSFMQAATTESLAAMIRPSGYFNIKAKRLQNYVSWFSKSGRFSGLNQLDDVSLRQQLLSVNGVGPETADDIMLYAFHRPVFVIDAYTRRLLLALKLIEGSETYETLRALFENVLEPDVRLFQEYHALIVRHAKEMCTVNSDCRHCLVEQG